MAGSNEYTRKVSDADKKPFNIIQIGCGVVGSAYMNAWQEKGHNVVGIEASANIIKNLGNSYEMYNIKEDLSGLVGINLIMISVCTPVKQDGRLDMAYIYSTLDTVATVIRRNPKSTVVIRSTVTPGTVLEYKVKLEAKLGGQKANMAFQPEFLRARSAINDALYPWFVVLGTCDNVFPTDLYDLYLDYVDMEKIKIMSAEEAELLKIFHNSFNAAKISFFNQCDLLCKQMNKRDGTNIDTNVITSTLVHTCEGLRNTKYGTKAGHGYYGTCLPKDGSELRGLESEYGLLSRIFAEVVRVNEEVVKNDKAENREEVLHGDFQISCFDMMPADVNTTIDKKLKSSLDAEVSD